MPNKLSPADELRLKAKLLLEQAEVLDCKKPYLLVCVGGHDEPTATVAWMNGEPTADDAGEIMGFDNDDDHKLTVREISLAELMPYVEA